MKSILAFLCLSSIALLTATAIPAAQDVTNLVARNATIADSAAVVPKYAIDPQPFGAPCGMTWEVTISITPGDMTNATPLCKSLYNYVYTPSSQGKHDKKVDFIYLCPPQWATPTNGYGSRDIKFILTGPTQFVYTSFPAKLQILNNHDHTNIPNIPINVDFWWNRTNPAKLGFPFFTMSDFSCPGLSIP